MVAGVCGQHCRIQQPFGWLAAGGEIYPLPFLRREAEADQKCLGPRGHQQPPGEPCRGAGSAPQRSWSALGVRGHRLTPLSPSPGGVWGLEADGKPTEAAGPWPGVLWEGVVRPSALSPLPRDELLSPSPSSASARPALPCGALPGDPHRACVPPSPPPHLTGVPWQPRVRWDDGAA